VGAPTIRKERTQARILSAHGLCFDHCVPHAVRSFKRAIKGIATTKLGWALSRRRRKPGCVVLHYHRVGVHTDVFPHLDVANFRGQMAWLATNCRLIAPEDFRERARSGESTSNRPDVLVTFDDGYRDYFDHAYPILRQYGIRAMNFLCTRFVDDPSLLGWWDRLYLAVRSTSKPRVALPWAAEPFGLGGAGKTTFLAAAKDYIKRQPELEKEATTTEILRALDVDATSLGAPRQTMTWDEVRAAGEFTSYGGHTHNHVIVSRLDARPLEHEIRTCRDRIASETGTPVEMFAYPNGRAIDFTDEAKVLLSRNGFQTAFTTIDGINGADTDWLAAHRIAGGSSVEDLAWRLARLQF
jgi:peptidoglycan/xylan/chitin deacetylase (PgdA/CDA1 family)